MNLKADCANCFALCCVAPAFSRSVDFAIDKPAGTPCPNLASDFRCRTHTTLREKGFRGCTVYDCFGAGQKVSQETFGGRDWRQGHDTAREMFATLTVMRHLHELLYYLTEALSLQQACSIHDEIRQVVDKLDTLADLPAPQLLELDAAALRGEANDLLRQASELTRATVVGKKKNRAGADLIGKALQGANFRGANLRGAYLIGTDLRRADLSFADITGADTRDADLRGADLSQTLFLIQSQLDAARGDATTRLGSAHVRPSHWPS
ncbi:pentapeptide repeat-containing protein [Antrihabitans cavernicola]|uniref:Pentapeptide repeat-containing protein n=1 Tax=Antrihabitans cavernicola TaxID=2495913 RepID=A0A5A7SAI9_9NOCA|nr:pentapeptide repeat-containing protein [Spelaeibacter cavernicola]KAA0022202.1 pentapeptide repeat-containing protein [Spelaeibacter cavernicola]